MVKLVYIFYSHRVISATATNKQELHVLWYLDEIVDERVRFINPCHAECFSMPCPLLISASQITCSRLLIQNHILVTNSADPDQMASAEAIWSGFTLFAKAGHVRVEQDKGNTQRKRGPWYYMRTAESRIIWVLSWSPLFYIIHLNRKVRKGTFGQVRPAKI